MFTVQDLENNKLINDGMMIDSNIITDLLNEHDTTAMREGLRYYGTKNDIVDRKMFYYKDGIKYIDEEKTNNKIPSGWHKLLVDQKVGYLVGTPPILKADEDLKAYTDRLNLILGEEWHNRLNELVKNSSNKGTEWLHVYIDVPKDESKKGKFKFMIIPAEQIIPIYDTKTQEDLEGILYYYIVQVNGKDRMKVEWWTRGTVTFYLEDDNGIFKLDDTEKNNPESHYHYNNIGYGWGKVPFIEFANNEERVSDLPQVKDSIDAYDIVMSEMLNLIQEVPQATTILKGYDGTDLSEFNQNRRFYNTIKVSGEGGVESLTVDIPTEATKEVLDRLEDNIFMFGQGVNIKTERFGQSPSGIALKFLYAPLDLKSSILERMFRESVKRLLWFTTEYINIIDNKDYESTKVQVTFRKTMITNNKEDAEIAGLSMGIISDETIIANHPWVENVGVEQDRLQRQNDAYVDLDNLEEDD